MLLVYLTAVEANLEPTEDIGMGQEPNSDNSDRNTSGKSKRIFIFGSNYAL